MKSLKNQLIGLIVVALCALSGAASAASRLALVIGNSKYADQPLVNPINDANAIAKKLTALGFQVTKKLELRRDDIGVVVERFLERIAPGDEVVFFYAGHGLQVDGENYLVAVDASIRSQFDVPRNSISVGDFLRRLDATRASVRVVFLDACRNNPFTRAFRGAASRGLAGIGGAPSGTLISFATQPGGVAADGQGRNGLYTEQLLAHMDTPGLPVELMLKRVAASTYRKSRGEQQPWIEGSILGEFVFHLKVDQGKLTLEAARSNGTESGFQNELAATAWKYVEGSNSRAAYEAYLREFGKSSYARLARIKLATLVAKAKPISESPAARPAPPPAVRPPTAPAPISGPSTVREKWAAWQRSMTRAYERAASLADEHQKRAAMERFLRDYATDNPYDDSARQMRQLAQAVLSPRASKQSARVASNTGPTSAYNKKNRQRSDLTLANAAYARKDYSVAARLYRPLAERGNPFAQMRMGRLHYDGKGIYKSVSDAFRWWTKAANNGNADAQGSIGSMYARGMGTKKSPVLALKWTRLSAKHGSSRGMNNLGVLYRQGIGVSKSDKTAVVWYRKSALKGFAPAQANLGWAYAYGKGIRKNPKLAHRWLNKSADQGNAAAMTILGILYKHGIGVRRDERKAVRWYRRAAEKGHASAQGNLGNAYAYGKGIRKDPERAHRWLNKAADQGNAAAMNSLGVLYRLGIGVRGDAKEAVLWYRRAAEKGNIWAISNLAKAYAFGKGVKTNYRRAAKLYDRVEAEIRKTPGLTNDQISKLLSGR